MKQVDRYLLRHFLRIFALTVAACIGIYLLVDFFEKVGDFIEYRAQASHYLSYLLNSLPLIAVQVAPLAILMSMVLTLGGLGRSNEITALRACGLSLWRIVRPIMLAVVFITGGYLLVNELLVPLSARQLNRLLEYRLQGKPEPSLNSDRIWYRDGKRIIHVALAEPQQQRLQGVTIFELDSNFQLHRRLQIPELRYRDRMWHADRARRRSFDSVFGDLTATTLLSEQRFDIGRGPEDFARIAGQSGQKSARELWQSSDKLKAEGFDTTAIEVDLQTRLAAPFACLIMAFLGVPFSLARGRGSSIALSIGLSLAVGVAYFLLLSLALAFGYSGALPPLVAGWAANLIFLLLGVYLLLRTRE